MEIEQQTSDPSLDYWKGFCAFVHHSLKENLERNQGESECNSFHTTGFSLLVDVGGQEASDLLHKNGIDGADVLRFIIVICKLEEFCLLKVIQMHEKYKEFLTSSEYKIDFETVQTHTGDSTVKSCGFKEESEISCCDMSTNETELTPNLIISFGEESDNDNTVCGDEEIAVKSEEKVSGVDCKSNLAFPIKSVESTIVTKSDKGKNVKLLQNKVTSNQIDSVVRRSSREIRVSHRYSENKEMIQNLLKPDTKIDKQLTLSNPSYMCSTCKKTFESSKLLLTHWKSHRQNKKKKKCQPFMCHICADVFASYTKLKIHYKQHDSHKRNKECSRKSLIKKLLPCKESTNTRSTDDKGISIDNVKKDQDKVDGNCDDLKLMCGKCKMLFEDKDSLESHESLCGNECKDCHKSFTNSESLSKHERRHVGHKLSSKGRNITQLYNKSKRMYRKMGQFQCKICDKCFRYERNLEFHTTLHTGEKPNVCEVCGRSFRMKRSLMSHLRYHDKASHIKCDQCPKAFVDQRSLEHHKLIHSGVKPYSCDACGKKFRRLLGLRNHRRIHKTDEAIKCDVCDKTFVDKWGMLRHKTIHTGEKPFICTECGKTFRLKKGLMDHVKLHDKDLRLKCSLCPRTFIELRKLNLHLIAHTGEKPFICDKCGKGFMNAMNLKVHNRCHTGEKPYKCSFCERSFNQQGSLIAHERHHKGERPYGCDICGDSYITKSQLTIHTRKHFNDRPYKCDQCDYAAFTGSLLKIHKLRHSSEKPFKCSLCPSAFKRQHHLEVHSRTHVANSSNSENIKNEKIYNCPYCESCFFSDDLLSAHIATHEIVVVTTETAPDDIFTEPGPDEVAYNIVLL